MNPALQQQWEILQKKLLLENPAELEKELKKQVTKKLSSYLLAIPSFYLELDKYRRDGGNIPIIWQEGSTCLYSYNQKTRKNSPNVLIIPSLINRHYILDLEEGNSFVKYLASNGINTYLAAWGEPQNSELNFTIADYVSRVKKMIDVVYANTGRKVILTGYCMGGLLSLAAAIGKSDKIAAISFLATPWDFHAEDFARFHLNQNNLAQATELIENFDKIPAALMQAIFYYLHAPLVGYKFEAYSFPNTATISKDGFIAVENWVNDGISMTRSVAKECFINWVHHNQLSKLQWKIKGKTISPDKLSHLPAFFAIPKKDSIVPPACAIPLTDYFPDNKIIKPNAGHIGMIVAQSAKTQTWEVFLEWINERFKTSA